MPDKRQHRGPHPEDAAAFAPEFLPRLQAAVSDLCWLLTHGYAEKSASTLVGDRYSLTERQRMAVRRCACSDEDLTERGRKEVPLGEIAGAAIELDGFNVLTTIEAALAGGVILAARDGCYRDLASMHSSFRHVVETPAAIVLLGRALADWRVGPVLWYLDRPVSNSGRLQQLILKLATAEHWDWRVELAPNPDAVLSASAEIVATADSIILNRCARWFNLARAVVSRHIGDARVFTACPNHVSSFPT